MSQLLLSLIAGLVLARWVGWREVFVLVGIQYWNKCYIAKKVAALEEKLLYNDRFYLIDAEKNLTTNSNFFTQFLDALSFPREMTASTNTEAISDTLYTSHMPKASNVIWPKTMTSKMYYVNVCELSSNGKGFYCRLNRDWNDNQHLLRAVLSMTSVDRRLWAHSPLHDWLLWELVFH